jgi:hypothetical protein
MSGWVYVFANAVVPGHVKVGFTERDPEQRAKELAVTGLPGTYTVEFAVQVSNPRDVEREAHRILGDFHYRKEWFRRTAEVARVAIETATQGGVYQVWGTEGFDDGGSPLVPGHALRPYFGASAASREEAAPASTLAKETPPASNRPLFGDMRYECMHCQHVSFVPSGRLARCTRCGRTELVF